MSTYIVTEKAAGKEVYRYQSPVVVEWTGMELATHDHTALAEAPVVPEQVAGPRRLTKNQFIDKLGDAAYIGILTLAKQSVNVEAFVKRLEMATPDVDQTSVDLDDPRTVAGITAIGAPLQAMGIVDADWAAGVLA